MFIRQIELNLYAILVLAFLLFDVKDSVMKKTKTSKIYNAVVVLLIIIQGIEILSWLVDGKMGTIYHYGNVVINSLFYAITLIPISLWLMYFDENIIQESEKKKKRRIIYLCLNMVVVILVIINLFNGFIFSVTPENHYVRHVGSWVIMILNCVTYWAYIISLQKYIRVIHARLYKVIFALGIFPSIGAIIQMHCYGLTLIWPMMAIVTLAAYILIEREELKRDDLTGLYMRASLETRISCKIRQQQPFSMILIDLDDFKKINDKYGHVEGDKALRMISNVLSKSIKQSDSIYRIGGDEFILLIETDKRDTAKVVMDRICKNLRKMNDSNANPYSIEMSIGVAHYENGESDTYESLLAKADEQMYQNKRNKCKEKDGR